MNNRLQASRDLPRSCHPMSGWTVATGQPKRSAADEPQTELGLLHSLGPHPEEAALFARRSRRMAAGTISPVAVLRDARILRQALRSALLRTRLMSDIDMIRTLETQ